MFKAMPFGEWRKALAQLPDYVSQNRKRIRLFAESIAFCVVTSSLGWLGYEIRETVSAIERCVQKDPMLLNYKAPEYIFVDKAAFTGKFRSTSVQYLRVENVCGFMILISSQKQKLVIIVNSLSDLSKLMDFKFH